MQRRKPVPWIGLYSFLKECVKKKDAVTGRRVHAFMENAKLDTLPVLGDQLISLYSACGNLMEAHYAFGKIRNPPVTTWNSIIWAHIKHKSHAIALQLYYAMLCHEDVFPDIQTFIFALQAADNQGEGRLIHSHIIQHGVYVDSALTTALVDFYSECGCLMDVQYMFETAITRDGNVWCKTINAFALHGDVSTSIDLFEAMISDGLALDGCIVACISKSCTTIDQIRMLHSLILWNGFEIDLVIGSTLLDSYAKFGNPSDAYSLFKQLPSQDVFSWGALINGYAIQGFGSFALQLFHEMQQDESIHLDVTLYLALLNSCRQTGNLTQGQIIHDMIIRTELESDSTIHSSLVSMYATCGSIHEAHRVFDRLVNHDVVSWGAMIAGYMQNENFWMTLKLFNEMQAEGIEPDKVILLNVLSACSRTGDIGYGHQLHTTAIEKDIAFDIDVGNVLINMYIRCGSLCEAYQVFKALPFRDEISWGAMITGYVNGYEFSSAFELLDIMCLEQLKPDNVVYLAVLKACSLTGMVKRGRLVHDRVIRNGFVTDTVVSNTLVHMYATCGSLEEARKVFLTIPNKDLISWCTLLTGSTLTGSFNMARQISLEMEAQGLKADSIVNTSLLSVYGHSGALEEGLLSFKEMEHTLEQYNCLVDILSRTGYLSEANDVVQAMPFVPEIPGWMSLLNSINIYGSSHLGKGAFNKLFSSDTVSVSR